MENPNIVDIKSVTIKRPRFSLKLSKSIRQAEKVSQVSDAGKNSDSNCYSKTKKKKKKEKILVAKIMKQSHAFKYF